MTTKQTIEIACETPMEGFKKSQILEDIGSAGVETLNALQSLKESFSPEILFALATRGPAMFRDPFKGRIIRNQLGL